MVSHQYALQAQDVIRPLARIVGWLAGFTVVLHALNMAGLLPVPAFKADPDQTILSHQSRAARAPSNARILLIGDSSCLTSVNAALLGQGLPGAPEVLNLALYSGVSLRIYAEVAADFVAAHPGQVDTVVLLVTAGKLQDEAGTEYFDDLWDRIHRRAAMNIADAPQGFRGWAGWTWMETRVLPVLLAQPLRGGMGREFGFAEGISDQLRKRHGSGTHVGRYRPPPRPVSFGGPIAPVIARESAEARALITPRLVAGIMPMPESHPAGGYPTERDRLLREWNAALQADALLEELPPVLPDSWFANDSHINADTQARFTRLFAGILAKALAAPAPAAPNAP